MKRTIRLITTLLLVLSLWTLPVLARPDWPTGPGVQSEAGIVVDMDSGTVLFGQNIHVQEIPASITKILTALVVIENSNLDDPVTFSYDAVYNVEEGVPLPHAPSLLQSGGKRPGGACGGKPGGLCGYDECPDC